MKIVVDRVKTGEKLWKLRQEGKLSLKELVNELELETCAPIYHWESGRCLPTLDKLVRLAKLYGKTIEEIVVVKEVAC